MTRRYNILWMTSWFPEISYPVTGVFVREQARAVSAFDDITVLHLRERDNSINTRWELVKEDDSEITGGIPTFRYRSKLIHFPIIPDLIFLAGIIRSIASFMQRSKVELIHAHTYRAGLSGAIVANYLRIPLVITEHSSIFPSRQLTKANKIKAQLAFKAADVVIPVSNYLKKSIEANGISANFKVIGNTFDPQIFYYSPGKDTQNGYRLITVCNLKPEKKIDQLLIALSRLPVPSPDWNLSIAGTGPEEPFLRSLAHQLGIQNKVHFLGVLSKIQVAERLRQADFFVLPSQSETFSVATLEALACGLPVLVTKSGGPEEFVSEDSGLLIPTDDIEALQNALTYMLAHAREYPNEEIALRVKSCFSLEAVGDQIHQVYDTLLGNYTK